MNTAFDRESIRAQLRMWRDVDRRLALERAVEHLPDDALALLLDGMLRLDEHRSSAQRPSLLERVREHAAATRRGDHRGNYVIRNAHGQRQPWQTDAWIAATHNLFDLALADATRNADSLAAVTILVDLVATVDAERDRSIEFEENWAALEFSHALRRAHVLLGTPSTDRPTP